MANEKNLLDPLDQPDNPGFAPGLPQNLCRLDSGRDGNQPARLRLLPWRFRPDPSRLNRLRRARHGSRPQLRDGCVDDGDLASLIFEFGGPESGAFGNTDLNDDGIVDDSDLAEVIFNFGAGC
jgi:hypothetical protein